MSIGRHDQDSRAASGHLASGRPLDALRALEGRRDPHAQALRGIALAQLGELDRARAALSRALRAFRRAREPVYVAKALAAIAEIDLARRDLPRALRTLRSRPLRELGDHASAAYVDLQRARLLGLLGRREEARALLRSASWGDAAALAEAELLVWEGRFGHAARRADHVRGENHLLRGEARRLARELRAPRLSLVRAGKIRELSLVALERVRGPYIDTVRRRFGELDLERRPAQLELLLGLARGPVPTENLEEPDRARLRVEVSRLRRAGVAVEHGPRGYESRTPLAVLRARAEDLVDPIEARVADGLPWPPRAIAAALGLTVRSVERRLADSCAFRVLGRGRARRFVGRRAPGTATQLLLLARGAAE